jgi:NAD+ synthase (glutamine-hydrolysing)
MDQARDQDADLVAFPEMAITGYPAEDLLYKTSFLKDNLKVMKRVVEASRGLAVVVGFVDADGDIYNAAAVGYDGHLAGVYHKMYLPTYGVFDEDRYFRRGDTCPTYVLGGVSVGINICEDAWYPLGPMVVQREAGAEVIVNINASPYHIGKQRDRRRMMSTRASDNGLYVAYINTVGGQDELVFDGASLIFDPVGELVARGPEFREALLVADLDMDAVLRSHIRDPRSRKEDPETLHRIGSSSVIHVSDYPQKKRPPLPQMDSIKHLEADEEVYQALVTGTGDYVKKSGFSKVVIGLSGGIDSSITACVAVDALGADNVLGIAMPSRYSSEGSIVDAKLLTHNLGMELWTIPIEKAHQAYLDLLDYPFKGTEAGVAEENIQSRIRGNLLMAVSNKFNRLVLTTGNKSEMAMGYATLYGDMAGGFSVLKDVLKTLVYQLSQWRNAKGSPANVIPQSVLEKPPSAELRPDQRDDDTLPPYSLLDQVLKAYVEEDRSYDDIVAMGFDPPMVERIMTAVDRNEYKRRQAPPGVKITPKAFGKDRRLPIVNRYRQF